MPTTTLVEVAASTAALQGKTDSAGADVTDVNGEELRLYAGVLEAGIVQTDAFVVVPGTGLQVKVGSAVQKHDLAVVEGTVVGQGKYLVRFDAASPFNVTIAAADLTNARKDEVYLVVYDNAYDSSGRSLPRLAVRKGDPSGSPAAPGPDAAWKAYLLLATVTVPAGASSISGGNIVDERERASVSLAADAYTIAETDALLADKADLPLPTASTSVAGIVQLSSATNSSSVALAATASAVKAAYDLANHSHPYAATSHTHAYAASSHTHSYAPIASPDFTGVIGVPAGSVGAPVFALTANPDTGWWFSGTSAVYSVDGDETFRITSSGTDLDTRISGKSAADWFEFDNANNVMQFYIDSVRRFSIGPTNFSIWEDLDDIGNVEVLRANRTASGTDLTPVGFYSSRAVFKTDIKPLAKSPRFPGLQIIDAIKPIDFKRKSTKQREWGFLIEDFEETDDNLRYLTTRGDSWGDSPDDLALMAVAYLGLQDLRARVAALEAK